MIQTLQKRFILTAMIAISVFVLVLLGITNGMNAYSTYRQNMDILKDLCNNAAAGTLFIPENGSSNAPATATPGDATASDVLTAGILSGQEEKRGFRWFGIDLADNYKNSAVFFVVAVNAEGDIYSINAARLADGMTEEIKALAQNVVEKGDDHGRAGSYRFRRVETADGNGRVYVFHDISYQRYAVIRVAYTSLLVGILCIEIMYFFVRILARKAIRPIAQNMERQKQFVTDAGHELKTPVAIIMANTEAMELCTGETKWSRNIREQAQRLSGLTQNLLTLAKIDENTFMESVEQVSMTKTVNSVIDMFMEPAALKHILIEGDVAEQVELRANADMMTRLISTLLDNAVKYASSDSTVHISLKKADSGAVFVIKNRCDELPQCEPEKLFDRFYRADAARTQKKGGYGIGLSAAQAITELHKGVISVKYEPENVIAFTVKLPLL